MSDVHATVLHGTARIQGIRAPTRLGERIKKRFDETFANPSYGPFLQTSMQVLYSAAISASWTALECLAADLWVTSVNEQPLPLRADRYRLSCHGGPADLVAAQDKMRSKHEGRTTTTAPQPFLPPTDSAVEQHFTPAQVAQQWGVSTRTVRRLFANTPGVLKLGTKGSTSPFASRAVSSKHTTRSCPHFASHTGSGSPSLEEDNAQHPSTNLGTLRQ